MIEFKIIIQIIFALKAKVVFFLAFTHEIIFCCENFRPGRALIGYVKGNFQKHFSGLFTRGRNKICQIKKFSHPKSPMEGKNNSLYKLRKDRRKPQSKS